MKKLIVLGLVLTMTLGSCNTGSKTVKSEMDSMSYGLSVLNVAPFIQALDTVFNGDIAMAIQVIHDVQKNKLQMTNDEAYQFLNEYFSERVPARNLKESEEYLAKMEEKSGVMKTESGLLYEIIEQGGARATNDADTVLVNYVGTTFKGKQFDANDGAEFSLNAVIPAWTEGMKLVGEGGKIRLYAPSDMAYGVRGTQNGSIQPNEALIFDVELIQVKPVAATEE